MKIFVSWSGDKSKKTAELLANFFRKTIQAVEPWISTNIPKGSRSLNEISNSLEDTKIGIICLNNENVNSNWILFEAGALSKTKDAYVCNFLLDIIPIDIAPPLNQFQHTEFNKEDFLKLLTNINNLLPSNCEKPVETSLLFSLFEKFWPELEEELNSIRSLDIKPLRSVRDLLQEIYDNLQWQFIYGMLSPQNTDE